VGFEFVRVECVSVTKEGARAARETYKQWLPPVHNIYYLWTAELGFVGLAAHLFLFVMIIVTAIRNFKIRDEILFAVNAACLSGIVAILVDGVLSFTWRINSIMRIFWVFTAIIAAIQHIRKKDDLEQPDSENSYELEPAVEEPAFSR
jgi:O-antigen ligase